MPKLFRYLRTSYALIVHDLPNGKSATVAIIIFLQALRAVFLTIDAYGDYCHYRIELHGRLWLVVFLLLC